MITWDDVNSKDDKRINMIKNAVNNLSVLFVLEIIFICSSLKLKCNDLADDVYKWYDVPMRDNLLTTGIR